MDWNQRYQEKDTPWDKGSAAPPLLEYLASNRIEGKVLVPGCGTGHDVRALAAQGACVTGIDIAPLAIEKARAFPSPDSGSAEYLLADFLSSQSWPQSFDWLFEHTCFCAIEPSMRDRYAESAASALKPDGQILGIFFTHLDSESGPPFSTPFDLIESTFSPYFEIERQWRPRRSYPGRDGEESVILMRKR